MAKIKLPANALQDHDFLLVAWYWLHGGEEAPAGTSTAELIEALTDRADSGVASIIPWLWRVWEIHGNAAMLRQGRMLITDWWVSVSDELPVSELPVDFNAVLNLAHGEHRMFESEATGRPLAPWAKKLIPAAFDTIFTWKDGATLRVLRRPVVNSRSPQVRVFQEIGRVLAHCYLAHGVILHYMEEHEFIELFDAELEPRCTFAVRLRPGKDGVLSWQITEQRGIYNIFPDRRYWHYLAAMLGVRVSAFQKMPPGFSAIPTNQGTGEPPQARDPRADRADPIALEVWAAGHFRRPMVPTLQRRLFEVQARLDQEARCPAEALDWPARRAGMLREPTGTFFGQWDDPEDFDEVPADDVSLADRGTRRNRRVP